MFGCTGSCRVKPQGTALAEVAGPGSLETTGLALQTVFGAMRLSQESVLETGTGAGSEAGETRKPAETLGSGR